MKRSRFSEEQIIAMLKEQEAGMPTADVRRKHGVSSATFYKYKAKYGGLEVSDARRLRALEEENGKLKKLLAEAMLDNAILKDVAAKNGSARCEAGGDGPCRVGPRSEADPGVPGPGGGSVACGGRGEPTGVRQPVDLHRRVDAPDFHYSTRRCAVGVDRCRRHGARGTLARVRNRPQLAPSSRRTPGSLSHPWERWSSCPIAG